MWPFKKLKSKSDILDELALYRQQKMLEIDNELLNYKTKVRAEIEKLALQCAEQKGQYEHDFHYQKELKGIELAKLEASIATKKDLLAKEIALKTTEIERLNKIVESLISQMSNIKKCDCRK